MHVLGSAVTTTTRPPPSSVTARSSPPPQEERFSRKKHDAAFPLRAIEFCLQQGGLEAADLDYVVFYEKPFAKGERLMTTIVATFPRSLRLFREGMHVWLKERSGSRP